MVRRYRRTLLRRKTKPVVAGNHRMPHQERHTSNRIVSSARSCGRRRTDIRPDWVWSGAHLVEVLTFQDGFRIRFCSPVATFEFGLARASSESRPYTAAALNRSAPVLGRSIFRTPQALRQEPSHWNVERFCARDRRTPDGMRLRQLLVRGRPACVDGSCDSRSSSIQ